MLNFSNLLKFL